ncbi:regulatory protein RecX [Frigoribacterium salinisoli]
MTAPDAGADDLAPVTPLFGRRGGAARAGGAPAGAAASDPSSSTDVGRASTTGPDGGRTSTATTDAERRALAAVTEHWAAPATGAIDDRAHDDEPDGPDEPEGLEAQRRRAENVSLHALSRRGVSSAEMTRLLRDRDLDESVVADEVARLEGVGLLDDAQLARDLVEQKQRRKGLGRGAVSAELRQRGLDGDAVTAALDDIDDDDEQARADEWARKRASSLRGLDRETAERRLHGYLQRRGYRSETVRRAIERALPRGGAKGGGVRFE